MPLKPRLDGKVAIVTGAGSVAEGIGNGRATAILFAREGARVLIVDCSSAAAEMTLEMIQKEGGKAETFVADVTKADDCRAMVDHVVKRWGKLDILDNNVGIRGPGNVVDVEEKNWDLVMAVNAKSMMLTGKYAIPVMVSNGGGSIVNISSIAAFRPRGLTPYSASKGAVIALTKSMALDHAKNGIRVNCVVPGPAYTPLFYQRPDTNEEQREKRRLSSPLEREGTGWDIAYAVLFLASDEARWITGSILTVDGGISLTRASC